MDLLDKKGSIYGDKPALVMAGELTGCDNMLVARSSVFHRDSDPVSAGSRSPDTAMCPDVNASSSTKHSVSK
jgi:hypothetical protein